MVLAGNGLLGLMETSEARYAEISREMVASGDWLSPHLNGAPHFTKPPLNYWGVAAGMALFGQNQWAARLWPSLCAALGLILLSGILRGEGDLAWKAPAALAGTLLFGWVARVPTTDPAVFALDMGIFLAYWRWRENKSPRVMVLFCAALFALAFLNKGPAGILVPLLVIPLHAWICPREAGKPTGVVTWLAAPFLFAGVAAPWFLLVWKKHPGLFEYMVTKEAAGGAVDASRFHGGDFFFYLPVILVGVAPWAVLALRGKFRDTSPKIKFLWVWAVLPLAVFSLFPAKLPTYILPVIPAWVALGLHFGFKREARFPALRWVALGLALLLAGVFAAAPFVMEVMLPPFGAALFLVASLLCLVWAWQWRKAFSADLEPRWWLPMAGVLLVTLGLPWALAPIEHELKFPRRAALAIVEDGHDDAPCLLFYTTASSVPFYLQRPVASLGAFHTHRKWTPEVMPGHFFSSQEDVLRWVREEGTTYVIFDSRRKAPSKEDLGEVFNRLFPKSRAVWTQGRYRVYKVSVQ